MNRIRLQDIKRAWHLVDAKNQALGRLSSNVARMLMGKNKATYTPYLDTGDYVIVVNAKDVALTGKKEKNKKYAGHSQYPGGYREQSASYIRQQNPTQLIRHAVLGMLPKTKLGKMMAKKLYIYPESNHPYQDKFKS